MSSSLRDSSKSADYYEAFIAKEQQGMAAFLGHNNAVLLGTVAPMCIRIVRAAYSGGATPQLCREWLRKAADYHYRFLAEGKKFALGGPGNVDDYLELYSGAYLVGEGSKLVQARRQCSYTQEKLHPVVTRLIAQFLDLLEGKTVSIGAEETAEATAVKKEWGCLPVLFSALSTRDVAKASTALDEYLAGSWGPPMDKWAKKALKAAEPEYTGKWSMFSAAACMLLGRVPDLGAKAKAYVPVELIDA